MTHQEIVMKLIGPVHPVGSSHIDELRLKSLSELFVLVEGLLGEIQYVSRGKDAQEHSVKLAGQKADAFLKDALPMYSQL